MDKIVETLALGPALAAMGRTAGALRLVDAKTNAVVERVAAMPKKVRLQVAAEAAASGGGAVAAGSALSSPLVPSPAALQEEPRDIKLMVVPDTGNEPQLVLENRKIALDAATSVQAVVDKIVETLARGAVSRGASASAPARHSERGRAACRSSGWLYGFIGLECR